MHWIVSIFVLDVRVINDLIEDLGRLETAKSQVQQRINVGSIQPPNSSDKEKPDFQHPSTNHRLTRLTSDHSTLGRTISSPGFGSKTSSINQLSKMKMMEHEIEGVQFNRKRMNSTISSSSRGLSISGDPSKYGDQVIINVSSLFMQVL